MNLKNRQMEDTVKYLCEENDNVIELKLVDDFLDELWIGHESRVGGLMIIGAKDLDKALNQIGLKIVEMTE